MGEVKKVAFGLICCSASGLMLLPLLSWAKYDPLVTKSGLKMDDAVDDVVDGC